MESSTYADRMALLHYLNVGDVSSAILKAHAYVESRVREICKIGMPEEASHSLRNSLTRASYAQLLRYAEILKLMSGKEADAFRELGKVRNRLAHTWRHGVSEADVKELEDAFKPISLHSHESLETLPGSRLLILLGFVLSMIDYKKNLLGEMLPELREKQTWLKQLHNDPGQIKELTKSQWELSVKAAQREYQSQGQRDNV